MKKFIIFDINDNLQKLLIGLIILFTTAILPIFIVLFVPSFNLGGSNLGMIITYLNDKCYLSEFGWMSYLLFFIIMAYLSFTQIEDPYKKIGGIILCIFLIYILAFPIITLINIILICNINNPPFITNISNNFPDNDKLEMSYLDIKNEYNNYDKLYQIECIRKSNPGLGPIEKSKKDDNCWRAVYLKKIGKILPEMEQFFPKTINLIKSNQIHNAFFSILDPNVEITPHTGYFKGYLRYHLGIIIPSSLDENNNKLSPYIICGGEEYKWTEGKGVLFDDMYLHYVKNPTNQTRVVLYLDVKRINLNIVLQEIVDYSSSFIENSYVLQKFIKNQHMQVKNEE